MTLNEHITRGKRKSPPRIWLYGVEGIGKSTLASQAPSPIFIPTEDGIDQIDAAKFPLVKSSKQFRECVSLLAAEEHEFHTVAIDSTSGLDRILQADVAAARGKQSFSDISDYGKEWINLAELWQGILSDLEGLRGRGMSIILIGHDAVRDRKDPGEPTYQQHAPRVHKLVAEAITEWCDAVGFASMASSSKFSKVEDQGFGRERLVMHDRTQERVVQFAPSAKALTKNRYGITSELPLSWSSLQSAFLGEST